MRKNIDRFLRKVNKTENCWWFTGGIGSTGYGVFWMDGRSENSHKASYKLLVGDVPTGKWVLHTCDNKACVNPSHLYLGTHADNTKDAVKRGRMATGQKHGRYTHKKDLTFENNPSHKLTKEGCVAIYNAILNGVPPSWIASQANLHLSTIYRAKYKVEALNKEAEP